jgi:MFS family permease
MSDQSENTQQIAVKGVNVGGNAEINVNQNINQSPQLTPEARTERAFLKRLLTKVNDDWLYILQRLSRIEIELELKTQLYLVKNAFSDEQGKIDRPPDEDTDIKNIFNNWKDGQRLLILGEPGAGKTIALLQIAEKFHSAISKEADKNVLEKPIPVVFHLSSWKRGQSIKEWLIQELSKKYGFPRGQAKNWVENQKLFLFLDGFDQVEPEYHQNCVEEINNFEASNIVVCSRSEQYEALSKDVRLNINHAVCIKPLTHIQINKYLAKLNKPGLKQILDEDKELLKLAENLFWLNIMTNLHERLPREGQPKDRKNKLFDEYIKTRFDKIDELKYDKEKTIKWLTWLASKSKSVFLIEEMQPSWLTKDQKKLYLIVTLCNGMILGLLFGIPYGLIIHFYISSSWGLLQGSLKDGIVLGIAAGCILGTSVQYFLKVHKRPIKTHKEVFLSVQKAKDTSWIFLKESVKDAIMIGGFLFLFCFVFLQIFDYPMMLRLRMGLIIGGFFGLITLIIRLLSNSLVEKKEVKTVKPNQGILDSRKKAYLMAKITTVGLAIINTLLILIIHHSQIDKLPVTLILGLCSALVTGGVAAFMHDSGRACQQHFTLRIVLSLTGDIPWNYAKFLDYVSKSNKLNFLNKIGGGYQFFNEMFKEHFASPKLNQRKG